MNSIAKVLIKNGITSIVSTHALSSILTSKTNLPIKINKRFSVITDIYAHSFWPKDVDFYFVPHKETLKTLVENGVKEKNIYVVGMPLRKEFYLNYDQAKVKREIRINNNYPVFLISGGSKGIGNIMEIVEVFTYIKHKINLIVFCGSNLSLKKELNYFAKEKQINIYPLSYQKNPAIYYAASDCVIGKAGGITVFEAASMKKPFIIYSPLPGQEERNAKFLVSHHCSVYPKNQRELKNIIDLWFLNRGFFMKLANNIYKLHKVDAPSVIVNKIINQVNIL